MSDEMSAEEYRAQFAEDAKPRHNKYGNKWTEVEWDGVPHKFQSKAEAARFLELKQMEQGGLIEDLELQPRFPLFVNDEKVGTYVGDFKYLDVDRNEYVLEDVKGVKTDVYKLKKKLVRAVYGIDVQEV